MIRRALQCVLAAAIVLFLFDECRVSDNPHKVLFLVGILIPGQRLTQARCAHKTTGETPLAARMRSDSVYKFRPGGILINVLPNNRASNE